MAGILQFGCKTTAYTLVCLVIIACTAPSKEGFEQTQIQRPVWPKPPAQARVEFVQEIAQPEDLGITPGIWSRIINFIAGKKEIRLIRPTSVVMTSDEVLFVADPGLKAVHRFDAQGKTHDLVLRKDKTAFQSPISLAVGPNNTVYVADSALNQIFVIDKQSGYASPYKTSVPLVQPTGLSIDIARERLYVVNTRLHQVLAFDRQGELLFRIGTRGSGDGQFNYPTQVWSDPSTGELWVTDSLNFRIQRFNQKGKFISKFSEVGDATGNLPRPKGVATDNAGNIYVVDALLNNMQIFNQRGELLLYLGQKGRDIGQFWLPVGIFIDGRNRIFVADSFNNRVQIFRYLENKG